MGYGHTTALSAACSADSRSQLHISNKPTRNLKSPARSSIFDAVRSQYAADWIPGSHKHKHKLLEGL